MLDYSWEDYSFPVDVLDDSRFCFFPSADLTAFGSRVADFIASLCCVSQRSDVGLDCLLANVTRWPDCRT